jgi:conflict system STAND superfamily ATPase/WD40 domain-containing protein
LEFVLKELWDKRRGHVLLSETYDAIGGLQGAVATKADEFFKGFSSPEQTILQRVFLRIVRPAKDGLDTRRRALAETEARHASERALFAEQQTRRAEEQARIAESRRLAAESSSALIRFPQRSLLLAVEALRLVQPLHGVRVAAAEQSLREALAFVGGRPLVIGQSGTSAIGVSQDNHWLVTGSDGDDDTARLWDLRAKDPAASPVVLRGHEGRVSAVAISPDNHWLVTGSADRTARLWPLQINDLIDLAQLKVGRNFFLYEWQLYFPGEPYHKTFPNLPGPD